MAGTRCAWGSHELLASSSRDDATDVGPPGSLAGGSPMHRLISICNIESDPMCLTSCGNNESTERPSVVSKYFLKASAPCFYSAATTLTM